MQAKQGGVDLKQPTRQTFFCAQSVSELVADRMGQLALPPEPGSRSGSAPPVMVLVYNFLLRVGTNKFGALGMLCLL